MWKQEVLTSPKIEVVKIITRFYVFELEYAINKAIEEGWKIYGNIITTKRGCYSIMMVKYEEVLK